MKLGDRLTMLEARVDALTLRGRSPITSMWEELMRAATARCPFTNGTTVAYMPGHNVLWSGRVIPLPVGARTHGNSGDPLVWVMRDGDNAIPGCYAHNLVRR